MRQRGDRRCACHGACGEGQRITAQDDRPYEPAVCGVLVALTRGEDYNAQPRHGVAHRTVRVVVEG
jgi:hypothetical protein